MVAVMTTYYDIMLGVLVITYIIQPVKPKEIQATMILFREVIVQFSNT